MQKAYGPGIEQITLQVAQHYAENFNFTLDSSFRPPPTPVGQGGGNSGFVIPPFALFLFILAVIFIINALTRNRRGCGGGGCIPLFIPMGGGGFGGGGGGSSW